MNDLMSRLFSNARGPELADALPDVSVVRCASLAANPRPEGFAPYCGAFNPGRDGAVGMGGPRAQRAAAANALRKWIFDPADDCGAGAREDTSEDREEAVSTPSTTWPQGIL